MPTQKTHWLSTLQEDKDSEKAFPEWPSASAEAELVPVVFQGS